MDLKEYLETKGISNKDFAKSLGVHPNTITNYIHWHKKPDLTIALLIEKQTKGIVTIKDLYYYWEAKDKYG
jgi:DNA-binding XRE family transcriptional regulator